MFNIADRHIGPELPPYIIAELSANHNGSLDRAKETILAARDAGAHAIKIQTYTPDTMTIQCERPEFHIKGGLWDGYSLYDLYSEAHTPFEWHKPLFDYARQIGITLFSTPFDETAVDLLESLDAPAYKIASFEMTDLPLLRYVARLHKPILMSTGMASEAEITESVTAIRQITSAPLLLFHCISSYPAPIAQANLSMMGYLRKKYGVEVGLSDHTLGNTAAIAATALGASAIEKHFILDRSEGGHDSQFSIEPSELRALVIDTEAAWSALGDETFTRPEAEAGSHVFRRSLYFVEPLRQGEVITMASLRRIRPGFGLAPKYFEQLLGAKVTRDVARGEPVTWDVIENGEVKLSR